MGSKYERETIITFNDAESTANVFSSSESWMKRIKKIKGWRECGDGVEVTVPKSSIQIKSS